MRTKIRYKITALMAVAVLLLEMVLAQPVTAAPEAPVTGEVTEGTVEYDAERNTLVMTDAVISTGHVFAEDGVAGIYSSGALTIELRGNNTILGVNDSGKVQSFGIYAYDTLTFTGSGTLQVSGGNTPYSVGIYGYSKSGNGIVFNGGRVTASGGTSEEKDSVSCGVWGVSESTNGVVLSGGFLYAQGQAATKESIGVLDNSLKGMDASAGSLVARAGKAAARYSKSYGIRSEGNLHVSGTAEITAVGGNATANDTESYGVCTAGNVEVSAGVLIGEGGSVKSGMSIGLSSESQSAKAVYSSADGHIIARGGACQEGKSYGVYNDSVIGDSICYEGGLFILEGAEEAANKPVYDAGGSARDTGSANRLAYMDDAYQNVSEEAEGQIQLNNTLLYPASGTALDAADGTVLELSGFNVIMAGAGGTGLSSAGTVTIQGDGTLVVLGADGAAGVESSLNMTQGSLIVDGGSTGISGDLTVSGGRGMAFARADGAQTGTAEPEFQKESGLCAGGYEQPAMIWGRVRYTLTLDANAGESGKNGTAAISLDGVTVEEYTAATYTTHFLDGYYTEAEGGSMVMDALGFLIADVQGYTDTEGRWINEGTDTLYARWLPAVSAEITWGAMEFEYSDGTWDPEKHEYNGGGWSPAKESGNTIKVKNSGEVALDVSVSYEADKEAASITGSVTENGAAFTNPLSMDVSEQKDLILNLEGKPDKEMKNTTIGKLVIQLKKSDSQ